MSNSLSVLLTTILLLLSFVAPNASGQTKAPSQSLPDVVAQDPNWDWLRLVSGEWLKGEFLSLEQDSLEFDSDILDEITLDWDDIADMYTNRAMAVLLVGGRKVVGQIRMKAGVAFIGKTKTEHDNVLRIAVGAPRKIDLWSGSISAGVTLRNGNFKQRDVATSARFTRRSVQSTFRTVYTGNYTEYEEVDSADNQRITANYDFRLNRKWYLQPLRGELYRDKFQNIESQWSLGLGASYYVIESGSLLWTISAGPGYQRTTFIEVPEDDDKTTSSDTFHLHTVYDHELTSSIDLYGTYTATWADEASGGLTQNLVFTVDVDIIGDLNLNVAANVDRIENPQADSDGVVPSNTDVRLTVGLSYDF